MKEQSIAILTVHGAAKMSPKDREVLLAWLRGQARFFEDNGHSFAKTFRARLLK